jgi:putative hydrolase of the HAD superfamily
LLPTPRAQRRGGRFAAQAIDRWSTSLFPEPSTDSKSPGNRLELVPDGTAEDNAAPSALLIDFGGVLTTSVFDSFRAFCVNEELAPDRFPAILSSEPRAADMFLAVEKGEISEPDFERAFAPMLGPSVAAKGLLRRLTGGIEPEPEMLDAVAVLRAAGVTTVLVSNSFGMHAYDGYDLEARFDHIVVSAKVGVRKPGGAIYRRATELAGCAAGDGLFVDDLNQNVVGARRCGLRAVLHTSVPETLATLSQSFGVELRSAHHTEKEIEL